MSELANEKGIVVNLPQNYDGSKPVEVIIRKGEATKQLNPKAPNVIAITGVIRSPFAWLQKRVSESDQVDQKTCFIEVDKDEYTIRLIVDEKNAEGTIIVGKLELSPIFKQFGINSGKKWSPQELGEFFKMNRSYFPSKETNMKLVSLLRNFTAKVDSDVEQTKDQKGSHSNLYRQTVISNLPEEFKVCLPVFKGGEAQEIVVETYADVDGGSVSLTLVSAGANEFRDEQVDKQIDSVIESIIEIAPDIVIIYK